MSNEHELLAHGEFIRSLARKLVPDAYWAADVAQQTMAAALEHPPAEDKPLTNWLVTVARNFARRLHRRESTRSGKERAFAVPETTSSTVKVVEQEEIRRKVVEAVLGLKEPYRTAVLMRFYEELPPREAAKRLGVPVETVRTRVKRGLEQLRSRLDGLYDGERRQWCAALAPIAAMKSGASLFTLPIAIGLAAVLIIAGAASLYFSQPDEPKRRATEVAANVPLVEIDAPLPVESTEPEEKLATIDDDRLEKTALAPETNRVAAGIVIHHETKRPLEGIRVLAYAEDHGRGNPDEYMEALTGPDGRFEITGIPWITCTLLIRDRHFHCFDDRVSFKQTNRSEQVVFEAKPGTYLLVRVLGLDGKPEPHARISYCLKREGRSTCLSSFNCNAEGEYFLSSGVEVGTEVTVVARGARSLSLSRVAVERPRTDRENEVTLKLEGQYAIRGRVEGGPGAGIQINPGVYCNDVALGIPHTSNFQDIPGGYEDTTYTDNEGGFTLGGLPPGRYRLSARPEGFEESSIDVTVNHDGSLWPAEVVLSLSDALIFKGIAVDEVGEPVKTAVVTFFHKEAQSKGIVRYISNCHWKNGTFHFPSRFTSPTVTPEDTLDLVVAAPGYVPFVLIGSSPVEKGVRAVLKRGGHAAGKVVSAFDDQPIPSFDITWANEAYDLHPDSFTYSIMPGNPWMQSFEQGIFAFNGLPPGTHELRVSAQGYADEVIQVEIGPGSEPVEGLVISLEPSLSISGRVLRAEEQWPFIHAKVSACLITNDHEKWFQTSVTADADGRFTFECLPPGSFELRVSKGDGTSEFWPFGPFRIDPGSKVDDALLSVNTSAGIVIVHVIDREGFPVSAGVKVWCHSVGWVRDGYPGCRAETNDSGVARIEEVRPGNREIMVFFEDGESTWHEKRVVEVFANRETVARISAPGSDNGAVVIGRVLQRGMPCADCRVGFSDGESRIRNESVQTDESGTFSFHGVEPGFYQLFGPNRTGIPVHVDAGSGVIQQDIVLDTHCISGILQLPDGSQPDNTFNQGVHCFEERGEGASLHPVSFANADREGRFKIEYLPEGRYILYGRLTIGDRNYSGFVRKISSWDDRLDDRITLPLQEACALKITGSGLERTDFEVYYRLEPGFELDLRYTMTGMDGEYCLINHLVPGFYRIEFKDDSGNITERGVVLEPGRTAVIPAP